MYRWFVVYFSLISLLTLSTATSASSTDRFLSIKYSKKNQLRTGLVWVKFKPELVKGEASRRTLRKGSDSFGVNLVSEDLISKRLPYAAIGKLFFTNSAGEVGSCSAAFAGDSDIVATAAHCVMSATGEWNGDFLFIRSYGSEQRDVYAIQCAAVPSSWGEIIGDDVLDHDFAFLKTNRRSRAGSLGITSGAPPSQVNIVGYSDNHSSGYRMYALTTTLIPDKKLRLSSKGNAFGIGNSGAPWLDMSTMYSVSSYYDENTADVMWGPRLAGRTQPIIDYVGKGCDY